MERFFINDAYARVSIAQLVRLAAEHYNTILTAIWEHKWVKG